MGIAESIDNLLGVSENGDESRKKALEVLQNVSLPVLQQINPELYKQIILENPEMQQAVLQSDSRLNSYQADPRLKQAQMSALNQLMDITANKGRDAQAEADASRLQNDINVNLQGNMGAIQQNMATRGLSGGLTEMVSKQLASQQAANRQAQMGLDLNAQAQQRALSALMNQSQLASNMESQRFNQAAQQANAQDSISRFNTQNLNQINANNIANINSARQYNNQNAQTTQNQNTALTNQYNRYNTNDLNQQQYDNQMNKQSRVANQFQNQGLSEDQQQANKRAFMGGLISSGVKAAAQGSAE